MGKGRVKSASWARLVAARAYVRQERILWHPGQVIYIGAAKGCDNMSMGTIMGQGYRGGHGGSAKSGKRKPFQTHCIAHHRDTFVLLTSISISLVPLTR